MIFQGEIQYSVPVSITNQFRQTKYESRIVVATDIIAAEEKVKKHIEERGFKFEKVDLIKAIE